MLRQYGVNPSSSMLCGLFPEVVTGNITLVGTIPTLYVGIRRLTGHTRKLAGQALRQCVNLGYHRSSKHLITNISPMEQEMQKRVFWSAYQMECAAAVMLGRPLSLRFEDMDAEVCSVI